MKRQALGRGLSALLSEEVREAREQVAELDIDSLTANQQQPRQTFDEAAIAELASSLGSAGLIQPIIVRRSGTRFEIVAGERRWRAAKKLGWKKIPALVRDLPPQKALEVALIENVQREALNPIEEAKAYEWLVHEYGMSQDDVATRVGKERSTISNMLRLLKLPGEVQAMVGGGGLSMGHARALLGIAGGDRQRAMAERIAAEGLSVRQVEEIARERVVAGKPGGNPPAKEKAPKDVHDRAAERRMEQALGTKVVIQRSRRGGKIEIAFYSEEELQRLYEIFCERK